MKKVLLLSLLLVIIIGMTSSGTFALFSDTEASLVNQFTAWKSLCWTQTTQTDFNAGVLSNVVVIPADPPPTGNGDVILSSTTGSLDTLLRGPSSSTGGWTSPTGAYSDDSNYAYVTSGTPSASETYSGYNIDLAGSTITQVRVRYDAWSMGAGNQLYEYFDTYALSSTEVGGDKMVTQTFSSPVSFAITDVELVVFRQAGWQGDITVSLYNTAGTSPNYYPTGSALTSVTLNGSDIDNSGNADPPPGYPKWRTFTFPAPYVISANTTYAIVVNATTNTGNKYLRVMYNPSGGYPRGIYGYTDTGAWDASKMHPSYDFLFKTHGYKYNDQIRVDVSWDGGASWSTKDVKTLTALETTYWYDVTTATIWNPTKLNDSNLRVRVDANAIDEPEIIKLDWLAVEVTYTHMVYVTSGTITSQIFDSTITGATWDLLSWDETIYSGTDITFEVRAWDSGDPIPTWTTVGGTSPVASALPIGQYKQWRATLTTSDTSKTPVLHEVRVWYDP